MKLLKKKQDKKQQPKYRAQGDGRLQRRRGYPITKSTAKKRTTGSLPSAVPLAITPTFGPWTHTSDDSYIYQLSLVLATATVSSTDEYPLKNMGKYSSTDEHPLRMMGRYLYLSRRTPSQKHGANSRPWTSNPVSETWGKYTPCLNILRIFHCKL